MEAVARQMIEAAGFAAPEPGGEFGLAALVDELAHGVAVTRFDARLLHANHVAQHELAQGNAISLCRDGFVSAPAGGGELPCAIARAAQGRRALVQLLAVDGRALSVAVVPLKDAAGNSLRCALLFSRRMVCDPLMLGFFARRHALTSTEEQVLAVLCEGLSTPQAATRMHVAVSTIRSHVRSICVKTRSKGVRQVVQRIAVLPPVAPVPQRALC
jgi:DNA-binding NarL/FixJ family response regulator